MFSYTLVVITFYNCVIIDSIILILQVILDFINSEPNSDNEPCLTFSHSENGMVGIEEEDPLLITSPVCEREGEVSRPGRHARDNTKSRLTERHFVRRVQPTGKKAAPQRRCVVCTKHGKRKDTRYCCRECDVGLCFDDCFEAYHTKLNY
jgi:hypothetical protein